MTIMPQAQLLLPFPPPPRVSRGRPVAARPEDEKVYESVLVLRRLGYPVYRAGADHKVDGRLLSTRALVGLAALSANGPLGIGGDGRGRRCPLSSVGN